MNMREPSPTAHPHEVVEVVLPSSSSIFDMSVSSMEISVDVEKRRKQKRRGTRSRKKSIGKSSSVEKLTNTLTSTKKHTVERSCSLSPNLMYNSCRWRIIEDETAKSLNVPRRKRSNPNLVDLFLNYDYVPACVEDHTAMKGTPQAAAARRVPPHPVGQESARFNLLPFPPCLPAFDDDAPTMAVEQSPPRLPRRSVSSERYDDFFPPPPSPPPATNNENADDDLVEVPLTGFARTESEVTCGSLPQVPLRRRSIMN